MPELEQNAQVSDQKSKDLQQQASAAPQSAEQSQLETVDAAAKKASDAIRGILDSKKPEKQPSQSQPQNDGREEVELEREIKKSPSAWRVYEGFKKTSAQRIAEREQKIASYEAKIKELESKSRQTPQEEARVKQLEQRIEELSGKSKSYEQRIEELDYRQSEAFKEKFVVPWQQTYLRAVKLVESLNVLDELGDISQPATQQDFDKLRSLPAAERRGAAREMFGDDAAEVLSYIRQLDEKREEADIALQERSKNIEKLVEEKKQKQISESAQFDGFKTSASKQLESEYPEYFSVDHYKDDPELKQMLMDGYDYVDTLASNQANMPKDELAAATAVVRARAAAFPLLWKRLDKATKELESLKGAKDQKRKSDPGSSEAVLGSGVGSSDDDVGDIISMASRFD